MNQLSIPKYVHIDRKIKLHIFMHSYPFKNSISNTYVGIYDVDISMDRYVNLLHVTVEQQINSD